MENSSTEKKYSINEEEQISYLFFIVIMITIVLFCHYIFIQKPSSNRSSYTIKIKNELYRKKKKTEDDKIRLNLQKKEIEKQEHEKEIKRKKEKESLELYNKQCSELRAKYGRYFTNMAKIYNDRNYYYHYEKNIEHMNKFGLLDKIKIISLTRINYLNTTIYQIEYIIRKEKVFYGAIVRVPLEMVLLKPVKSYENKSMKIVFDSDKIEDEFINIINPSTFIVNNSKMIIINYPIIDIKNVERNSDHSSH